MLDPTTTHTTNASVPTPTPKRAKCRSSEYGVPRPRTRLCCRGSITVHRPPVTVPISTCPGSDLPGLPGLATARSAGSARSPQVCQGRPWLPALRLPTQPLSTTEYRAKCPEAARRVSTRASCNPTVVHRCYRYQLQAAAVPATLPCQPALSALAYSCLLLPVLPPATYPFSPTTALSWLSD